MENQSITKVNMMWGKIKLFLTKMMYYIVIIVSLGVGFAGGFYYRIISDVKISQKPEVTRKSDINLAIDEKNGLIIINQNDGSYITYEDSVGYGIFNLYARSMYGQHSVN